MRVYNSIPGNIKTLVGVSQLHYVDAFESDFSLLLSERKSTNIPAMFKDALEVEVNLITSEKMKQRVEVDRRRTREEHQTSTSIAATSSSSNDAKFEMMMKTMERLMDRFDLDNGPPNREKIDCQIRNQN